MYGTENVHPAGHIESRVPGASLCVRRLYAQDRTIYLHSDGFADDSTHVRQPGVSLKVEVSQSPSHPGSCFGKFLSEPCLYRGVESELVYEPDKG